AFEAPLLSVIFGARAGGIIANLHRLSQCLFRPAAPPTIGLPRQAAAIILRRKSMERKKMPFWDKDELLDTAGRELVDRILTRNKGLGLEPDDLSVVWVVYDPARLEAGQPPRGYGYRADLAFYPCSIVKCFWLAACHARLEEGY